MRQTIEALDALVEDGVDAAEGLDAAIAKTKQRLALLVALRDALRPAPAKPASNGEQKQQRGYSRDALERFASAVLMHNGAPVSATAIGKELGMGNGSVSAIVRHPWFEIIDGTVRFTGIGKTEFVFAQDESAATEEDE